mmetsp:Transcript_6986/g.27489  ORF Transcript_6986/g.27489 Transcript_6986/m.27489 type:complete len:238 (-) Transcript_6986:1216-1929(-)
MPMTRVLTSALVSARRLMASVGVISPPPYPTIGLSSSTSSLPSSFLSSEPFLSADSFLSTSSSSSLAPLLPRPLPLLGVAFLPVSFFSSSAALDASFAGVLGAATIPAAASSSARASSCALFTARASAASAALAFSSSVLTCGRTVLNFETVVSRMRMRFARASCACAGSFRLRKMLSTRWCISRTHVIWIDSGSELSWTFRLNTYTVRRICGSVSSRRMWCTSSARNEYASGRSAS